MGVSPQDGARIIFAGTTSFSTLQSAVNYVWHKGAVIFAAGGNSSSSSPVCAAACDNVITVRATELETRWPVSLITAAGSLGGSRRQHAAAAAGSQTVT
jgi:hypothetical protein